MACEEVVRRTEPVDGLEGTSAPEMARSIEALFREEYGRIRRLAWRFGLPEDELDDAAQEVFVRVWVGVRRFRGESSLSTWLTRIAVNYFTSRRRAVFRRLRTFLPQTEGIERVPAKSTGSAQAREAYARAVACVRRLPTKQRQVFVLRYLEEMSCAEVAETLGIPDATVRTRAFYACRKLRDMMKGHEL